MPLVGRLAIRLGAVAFPDPAVKRDTQRTPLLGGLAVLAGIAPAMLVSAWHDTRGGLLAAAITLVAILGAYKDRVCREVSPLFQLGVQTVAVGIVICAFGPLPLTGHSGLDTAFSIMAYLWLLNAWNFLDIMDGLAGGVALITATFFLAGQLLVGNREGALLGAALAGGMLGFLLNNYPPARIFMGDVGSFSVGLLFCGLASSGVSTGHSNAATAFGVLLFLPLAEVPTTCLTRVCRGRSPLRGHGPDHLSLRLLHRGWSERAVIWSAYLVTFISGLIGLGILSAS